MAIEAVKRECFDCGDPVVAPETMEERDVVCWGCAEEQDGGSE